MIFRVYGSKNSSLPILASLVHFSDCVFIMENVPRIIDVLDQCEMLNSLGVQTQWDIPNNQLIIDTCHLIYQKELKSFHKTRASLYFLGSLYPNNFKLSKPGGCRIGQRNINEHIRWFQKIGVNIHQDDEWFHVEYDSSLFPEIKEYTFEKISVGATINAILSSINFDRSIQFHNVSIDPSVTDLCDFLRYMGLSITILDRNLYIEPKKSKIRKQPIISYRIPNDPIVCGTYLVLASICKCYTPEIDIFIEDQDLNSYCRLGEFWNVLSNVGISLLPTKLVSRWKMIISKNLNPFHIITGPFPGIYTDLGPFLCMLAFYCKGSSSLVENVFEDRFEYVDILIQLGFGIKKTKDTLYITPISLNFVMNKKNKVIQLPCDLRGAAMIYFFFQFFFKKQNITFLGVEQVCRGYILEDKNIMAEYYLYKNESSKLLFYSKDVQPGDIFLVLNNRAIPFVQDALNRGAAWVITDLDLSVNNNENIIHVLDLDTTLKNWVHRKRMYLENHYCRIIAITGSNGKTTTKDMLSFCLRQLGAKCFSSPKSYNTFFGLAITICNAPLNTKYLVLEFGTNQPGEIMELRQMCRPFISILLNVTTAHLGNFASWQDLMLEKKNIFHDEVSYWIYNADQNICLSKKENHITFGLSKNADFQYLSYQSIDIENSHYKIRENLITHEIDSHIIGSYNAYNIMATMASLTILDKKIYPIRDFYPSPQRGTIITLLIYGYKVQILDHSYNANPNSLQETISSYQFLDPQQILFVIGEMLELGSYSFNFHQKIQQEYLKIYPKILWIGKNWPNYDYENVKDLILDSEKWMNSTFFKNTPYIYVKGSNSVGLEEWISKIRSIHSKG